MENKKLNLIIYLALIGGVIYFTHRQIQRNGELWITLVNCDKELALKDREIEELEEKLKKNN
jgi:hypothetical protein